MARVSPLGLLALLVATACTSSGSSPAASPGTSLPSYRSAAPTTEARWPKAVTARRETGYAGQKPIGSTVPATAVSERSADGRRLYGLADCASLLGSAYPAVSSDGGRSWRITGPQLYRAAAQGAAAVDYITGSGPVVVLWGSSIVTSPDSGRTWWRTYLGGSVRIVVVKGDTLIALAQGDSIPASPTLMQTARYRSRDGGRSWRLDRPVHPTPAGPIGPHGSIHPVCG